MSARVPASGFETSAPAADAPAIAKFKRLGPIRLIIVCAVLLSAMVAVSSGLFLLNLHKRVLAENERNLSNTALVVAKQIEHIFTTVENVQKDIIADTAVFGIFNWEAGEGKLPHYDIHLKLRDKAAGMPYVGSLTVVDAQGRMINFSRQWPVPEIHVSDRDFFKAFQSDPNLTSFIGEPVRNRVTGTWVMHLARKISGLNGEFLGLTTAAIELQYLQNIFSEITFEPGSGISLLRNDGTLLARIPRIESEIGRRFPAAVGLKLISTANHGAGVGVGGIDGQVRMVAAHRVGGHPILVATTKTIAMALADWRRTELYLIFVAGLTIAAIAAFAFLFIRQFRNYQALVKARAERENAEKLRDQSLQFGVALNSMSQGVAMFDASARIVVCNERYVKMYGLSADVVKPGLTLLELIKHRKEAGLFKGDPAEYCSQILDQVAKGQIAIQSVETTDNRTIHIVDQPLANGGWIATHEDITEQRKVERERDYNRKFLDTVIENVPSTIVVKNARDFTYALINRAGENYYGMPRDKMLGRTAYDILPKESADHVAALDKKLLNSSEPSLIDEHTLAMPSGEIHIVMSKRLCIRDEHGEPQYLLAVIEDITAQRETKDKLDRQKQQIDTAIGNMAQGLAMFDASEQIVLCNQRYIDMYGLPQEFLQPGRALREILQVRQAQGSFVGDIDAYRQQLLNDISQGETKSLVVNTNDGRSLRVVNVPMAGGGWVATHEDITEQVTAKNVIEAQKLQLNVALENMSQGLCLFDASQRLIVCNKRYAEIYGLNDEHIKPGTSLRAILEYRIAVGNAPADQAGYVDARIKEVTSKINYQVTNKLSDGRYVSIVHRQMADGGWVATHEDVTEARRREESFRLLFEGNPVPMWITDLESLRFIAVNEAAIAHYGYSREQFMTMTVADLRPTEDFNRFAHYLHTLPAVQLTGNIGQHWKADGTAIDVSVFSRTLNYSGHQARLAVIHDITKAKLAEDELRRTKNFIDAVIEHVPLPIIVKDVTGLETNTHGGRFTLFNRAYEELTGDSRAGLIGKTPHQLYSKERADFIVQADKEALNSDKVVLTREHPIPTSGKGTRIVTAKKTVIRNDGKPQYLLTVLDDVTERRHAEARIAYLARNDSLTDLPNRATFVEFLAATLDEALKTGEQFSILCLDLDRFKEANDAYGHLIGDGLLREVARRLQAAAAGTFLARVGGDEFTLIVTSGAQPATAEALAKNILAAFKDDFDVEGCRLQLGTSVGVAVYPADGADAKTLMANADAALYQAKAEERGSVRFFAAELGARMRERRELQKDIQLAITRGEFLLHYQPQEKIASGKTIGFEALVRWQCPKRGMVPPGKFISVAEESSLIIPLGEWIMREACREAATWREPLTIAVNISPVQFHHGDLPALVHSILLETGLKPSRLELEITEGVLIDDFSRAVSILRKLKSLGVQIAMDDFGSGYSSLSYLHSFPFDKIKIDRSFIGDLEHNHHSMAIVRAIITLGHSLEVPVLAEGVETNAQHLFLAQEGCDEVQGYLLGRPLQIEAYANLVGRAAQPAQNNAKAV